MLFLTAALTFLLGLAAGAAACWFILSRRESLTESAQRHLQATIQATAAEALNANTQHLLTLMNEKAQAQTTTTAQELDGKKQLIDSSLTQMKEQLFTALAATQTQLQQLEKERATHYATLGQRLTETAQNLTQLHATTADLRNALSNSRTRGQWGERIAEDVLRHAGLQENLQYRRQSTLAATENGRGRPDYTFLLPGNRVIHMDVKFPLDNYLAHLNAQTDGERTATAQKFVTDVRNRLRETDNRDYRNAPTMHGEQPLEWLLIFIPNEQVYAFLLETAPDVLSTALAKKVILCSPTTLLAVLAVVAQAAQHFRLQQQAQDVHTILTGIRNQWEKYSSLMSRLGERLAKAQEEFTSLTTTRTNALDREFARLDSLQNNAPDPAPELSFSEIGKNP